MSFRFGRGDRLRRRGEFTAVQTGGRRVATRYLTLLGKPNSLAGDRLGIIASRRLGNAVERNRAKRRVRELFRQRPIDDGDEGRARQWDLVVIPKRELLDAPVTALTTDFLSALRRMRGAR